MSDTFEIHAEAQKKICSVCKEEKRIDLFHRQKAGKSGRTARCKECSKKAATEWYRKNKDRAAAYSRERSARPEAQKKDRDYRLFSTYKISPDFYSYLTAIHGDLCGICGNKETAVHGRTGKPVSLSVDHDHGCCSLEKSCGKCIRGLLCRDCNVGIAKFHDDPERLSKAIAYLGKGHIQPPAPAKKPEGVVGGGTHSISAALGSDIKFKDGSTVYVISESKTNRLLCICDTEEAASLVTRALDAYAISNPPE